MRTQRGGYAGASSQKNRSFFNIPDAQYSSFHKFFLPSTVIQGTIATVCLVNTHQSLTPGWKSHMCFQLMDQWWNVMISLDEKGTDSCQYWLDSLHLYLSTQSSWPQLLFFSQVQVNISSPVYAVYCQLQKKTDKT